MPLIDIIIVNYNSTEYTTRCIKSIYQTKGELPINIIVSDNSSNDNPDRLIKSFPEIKIFYNQTNLGFSKAVNKAFGASSAPYVVFLNPDTVLFRDFFDKIIKFLEKNPKVGIIGPRIIENDGTIQGSARKFPTFLSSIFGRKSPITAIFPNNPVTKKEFLCFNCTDNEPIEVDWVSGACMVSKRKILEKIGVFDENFFLYWEDTDLCKRVKGEGFQIVYYPAAELYHITGASSDTAPISSILHFHKSCYLLYRKYAIWPQTIFLPIVFGGLCARCLVAICVNRIKSKLPKSKKHQIKIHETI